MKWRHRSGGASGSAQQDQNSNSGLMFSSPINGTTSSPEARQAPAFHTLTASPSNASIATPSSAGKRHAIPGPDTAADGTFRGVHARLNTSESLHMLSATDTGSTYAPEFCCEDVGQQCGGTDTSGRGAAGCRGLDSPASGSTPRSSTAPGGASGDTAHDDPWPGPVFAPARTGDAALAPAVALHEPFLNAAAQAFQASPLGDSDRLMTAEEAMVAVPDSVLSRLEKQIEALKDQMCIIPELRAQLQALHSTAAAGQARQTSRPASSLSYALGTRSSADLASSGSMTASMLEGSPPSPQPPAAAAARPTIEALQAQINNLAKRLVTSSSNPIAAPVPHALQYGTAPSSAGQKPPARRSAGVHWATASCSASSASLSTLSRSAIKIAKNATNNTRVLPLPPDIACAQTAAAAAADGDTAAGGGAPLGGLATDSSFGLGCGLPGLSHEVSHTISQLSAVERMEGSVRVSALSLQDWLMRPTPAPLDPSLGIYGAAVHNAHVSCCELLMGGILAAIEACAVPALALDRAMSAADMYAAVAVWLNAVQGMPRLIEVLADPRVPPFLHALHWEAVRSLNKEEGHTHSSRCGAPDRDVLLNASDMLHVFCNALCPAFRHLRTTRRAAALPYPSSTLPSTMSSHSAELADPASSGTLLSDAAHSGVAVSGATAALGGADAAAAAADHAAMYRPVEEAGPGVTWEVSDGDSVATGASSAASSPRAADSDAAHAACASIMSTDAMPQWVHAADAHGFADLEHFADAAAGERLDRGRLLPRRPPRVPPLRLATTFSSGDLDSFQDSFQTTLPDADYLTDSSHACSVTAATAALPASGRPLQDHARPAPAPTQPPSPAALISSPVPVHDIKCPAVGLQRAVELEEEIQRFAEASGGGVRIAGAPQHVPLVEVKLAAQDAPLPNGAQYAVVDTRCVQNAVQMSHEARRRAAHLQRECQQQRAMFASFLQLQMAFSHNMTNALASVITGADTERRALVNSFAMRTGAAPPNLPPPSLTVINPIVASASAMPGNASVAYGFAPAACGGAVASHASAMHSSSMHAPVVQQQQQQRQRQRQHLSGRGAAALAASNRRSAASSLSLRAGAAAAAAARPLTPLPQPAPCAGAPASGPYRTQSLPLQLAQPPRNRAADPRSLAGHHARHRHAAVMPHAAGMHLSSRASGGGSAMSQMTGAGGSAMSHMMGSVSSMGSMRAMSQMGSSGGMSFVNMVVPQHAPPHAEQPRPGRVAQDVRHHRGHGYGAHGSKAALAVGAMQYLPQRSRARRGPRTGATLRGRGPSVMLESLQEEPSSGELRALAAAESPRP